MLSFDVLLAKLRARLSFLKGEKASR